MTFWKVSKLSLEVPFVAGSLLLIAEGAMVACYSLIYRGVTTIRETDQL